MADRDFDCILCQRHFVRMTADMILPEDQICDECLAELCELVGEALRKRINERRAGSALENAELDGIVSAIQRHDERKCRQAQASRKRHVNEEPV